MSRLVVAAVGLACKVALGSGFCSVTVRGLPVLRNALESAARDQGQGVLTVANHISTFFSTFFRLGQTLETMRGKGIYQPAVDFAIDQLNKGGWVHLYAEGKVNQPDAYPTDEDGVAHLPRFKWGVGRMVMESTVPPVIIPMWLTGFDRLMPQGRAFPYNYLPRPGAELSVTFGNPIPPDSIRQGLLPPSTMDAVREVHSSTVEQLPKIRSRVTSVIHDAVEDLGRSVSGKLLYPPRQG